MPTIPATLMSALLARTSNLRFPTLTAIAIGLFLVDLVVPDFIPIIDEVLLGLLAAALASWKTSRRTRSTAPDVAPGRRT